MIYMTPTTTNIDKLSPRWGLIRTPSNFIMHTYGRDWCVDNEAFTKPFNWTRFEQYLINMDAWSKLCLFVVCPDIVYNPIATMALYRNYAWRIKDLDYPVAFVAQDGQESLPWPPEYDVLFIGGSTEWKLSSAADWCIKKAKRAGKWVHVGRVNSQKRIAHFQIMGVDSVDGTGPAIEPDGNQRRYNRQLDQRPLFTLLGE